MGFQMTTAVHKIANMKGRKRIIQGGTWSGKTYGVLVVLINHAISTPSRLITVVAETIPALKSGAIRQFKDIMMSTGRWNDESWNANDLSYSYSNDSVIEFKSFDSIGKALASGKRTDLFINEAQHQDYEIVDALIMRTEDSITFDYNPSHTFFIMTEIMSNPDAEFLLLKASDNEALPENIKRELSIKLEKAKQEKEQGLPVTSYWQNWCRVYIDGEVGNLIGQIYSNWSIVDDIPSDIPLLCYGADWGFSSDPSTLLAVYQRDKDLFLKELIYETGLTNNDFVSRMNVLGISKTAKIIGDSSEPKTLEEIRRHGYNIVGAKKGPDSVRFGINKLQEYKLHIHASSLNLIKELRAYRWRTDKNGKATGEPIDSFNHLLDPARYITDELKTGSLTFDYFITSI
jgi:phage terminase large subunit